jgi:hypothetical protein
MNRTNRIAALVALATMTGTPLLGCGEDDERAQANGCVIVDLSRSARNELGSLYLPGFQKFVDRMATEASGNVCFTFAAQVPGRASRARTRTTSFGARPNDERTCSPPCSSSRPSGPRRASTGPRNSSRPSR